LVDVVRDLGAEQFLRVLDQHAGYVQGHVPVADHRNLLGLQRPLPRHVRVAVVPGHEVCPAEGALQLNARNVQVCILDGTRGEDDGVIEGAEVVQGQVPAVGHVAQEPDVAAVQDLVQGVDNPLDPGVVGRHAVADQSVGRRVRLEKIDADLEVAVLHATGLGEDVRSIDPRGSRAHDGNAERTAGGGFAVVGHLEPF
jgi:hypothetical protein